MKWTHQALKRRTNLWQTWSEICVMQRRRRKSHCFQASPSWLLLPLIAYGPYIPWHTPRFAPFSSRSLLFLLAGSEDVKDVFIFSFIIFFQFALSAWIGATTLSVVIVENIWEWKLVVSRSQAVWNCICADIFFMVCQSCFKWRSGLNYNRCRSDTCDFR
jgi:hypothetical protein